MKKIFAMILVLAMLVPLGLVPAASAEGVTAKPFYAISWSDMDNEAYPYLDGLVTSAFAGSGDIATISFNGAKIVYNEAGLDDASVTKFAETLKKSMDARPEGMRYWHLWAPGKVLRLKPEHVIYLDYGVDMMKVLVTAIMKKYKEIGGPLDGIVIDTEYGGLTSFYLSKDATKDPLLYKNIVADPRYATEVRPLLAERGFPFWPDVTDYTPEIYSADQNSGSKYELARNIWNTVMRNRLAGYLNEWAYEPLKTYFPEASMSDYQTIDSLPWLKLSAINDNGEILTGGTSFKAGTASSFSFYSGRPSDDFYKNLQKYAAFNDAIFEASAFNTFLYDMNFAKHMYLSNDMRQIAPWITSYRYNRDKNGTLADTPYYIEEIYHLGLLDPEPFLSYTYSPSYTPEDWEMTCQIMNAAMAELTRVAGYSDRKPIETAPYWNSEFVLSGMYANGRNIWRITPNGDEISLADFKVEGTDPTFCVKGRTVTFPGGKIIEDTTIPTVGTHGYWVETAKDVTPIITNDAARYAKFPSLLCDFEDEKEGAFDYNNHNIKGTWEFTWKKDSGTTIETVNGNKVLVATGTSEIRNAKLPGNITAGDSYAEDQAWQVTVTIPEDLSAEAEITLLNYAGTRQMIKDGGFKIAGGKLYYSAVGKETTEDGEKAIQEFKELMDIAPGTYLFRREMNLNNAEDFRCNYAVYDTTGKELKRINDVATPVYTAITTINFATKDADKPVYFDNYSISLTGITTDFEIYDATHGIQIPDENKDAARDRATAYRLSWLNATAKEETATVMAAIYQGETLLEEKVIKEIKMAPGYDNVDTGIVEVAEGQTVKVYLKTSIEKTGSNSATGGISPAVIAVIAAAVVAVALVVVLLVVKKPKAKTEE